MTTREILDRLIAFPTVSRDSNLDLISHVRDFLGQRGISSQLIHDEGGTKANLYATVGPQDRPGVMLSGHTDVVPVDGQDWTVPPFAVTERAERLHGRGTADMKGFIASVLAFIDRLDVSRLTTPVHLAFSHDEEVGCVGVRRLISMLESAPVRPRFCIVGEPTSMQVVSAHKGKTAGRISCRGHESHSSLAPDGLNAIYLATDMIAAIRAGQDRLARSGPFDEDYEVAYTTLHVGTIEGGTALNIVPRDCRFAFEIRHLPADDPDRIVADLRDEADRILSAVKGRFPDAAIGIEITNAYPALDTPPDSEVIGFVKSLTGANRFGKISFGTEGGLFSTRLGIQTVVIGPGDIAQAHKPDEYIDAAQLEQCDRFLDRLGKALSA